MELKIIKKGKGYIPSYKLDDENIMWLDNVEEYPGMSQETLAYSADIVINGAKAGKAGNNGGGSADDIFFEGYNRMPSEEARNVEEAINKMMVISLCLNKCRFQSAMEVVEYFNGMFENIELSR